MDWIRWAGILVGVLVAVALAIDAIGAWRWNNTTRTLLANLYNAAVVEEDSPYAELELANLPAPVQRYFRVALREGQPIIKSARFSHEGRLI